MNNSLSYILKTRFKNKLISTFAKPSGLIMAVVFILLFATTILGGNTPPVTNYRDINELYAIVTLLFGFVFIMTAYNGISKGASLFSMADVNLLFPSPSKSISILIYGLLQQMGTSLLLGFFILFQYSWIHTSYGVGIDFLIGVLLIYALMAFCGQLTAMSIYILTSSSDRKRTAAKYIVMGITALMLGYIAVQAYTSGSDNYLASAAAAASSLPVSLFPVAGWGRMILMGIFSQSVNITYIILGCALIAAYICILVFLVMRMQTDYYEDVLQATEVSFSAINARKEGKINEAVPKNVKVGKIGIDNGWGSSVFYYKHRVESRRTKIFIFDTVTLIYLAITVGISIFMKNGGVLPVLIFSTYMQIFSVALGRWTKEFILPYLYLVPEKPFKKLMFCLKESIIKMIAESVVTFGIIGVIMKLDIATAVSCIFVRISFGLLFTAGNLFVERFFGGVHIKIMEMLIYFLLILLFSVPGIVAAVILITVLNFGMALGFAVLAAVNILISLLILFSCRNLLTYAELNNQ